MENFPLKRQIISRRTEIFESLQLFSVRKFKVRKVKALPDHWSAVQIGPMLNARGRNFEFQPEQSESSVLAAEQRVHWQQSGCYEQKIHFFL